MEKLFEEDFTSAKQYLYHWLKRQVDPSALEWLDKKLFLIQNSSQKKDIFLAFSMVSKFIGKEQLKLNSEDLKKAKNIREGWKPAEWRSDEVARILLLLSINQEKDFFLGILKQLFETAEVSELRALYLGLPLYPFPERLKERAVEGFRTNINIVFNAIALDNPFPKNFLDETSWNQMVLKAVFIGSPLYKIQGLEERANVTLAEILSDFIHERWAAKRIVTPELWRLISPFINEQTILDLQKLISLDDLLQKKAAALAISKSSYPESEKILEGYPELAEMASKNQIAWDEIGKEWEKMNN